VVAVTKDQRAVVYSGEDARFEYIYKFVSRDRIKPGGFKANATLLDHGTLYVARFDADGRGRWLPLVHGQGPLTAANGFADQGEIVIKARQASDAWVQPRWTAPEWLAIDPASRWVYCTLTNNSNRGQAGFPGVDAANPRANNAMGHIIRWREDGDFDGAVFDWNHSCWPATRQVRGPKPRATSRATCSPAPTRWPSTVAACCGSAPT
jgi:secreted PhoX family phosphatase